uniref:PDZ domain-containing protein n=1 Tax=Cyprinus carpio TaxID=7962 RepID=A0A8C2EBA9_CYPCA
MVVHCVSLAVVNRTYQRAKTNSLTNFVLLIPSPRVCVLKREDGENFGFHLCVEKGQQGHVIRQLDSLGVAERSGLKDGDRLLEVNEMFVDNVEHMVVRVDHNSASWC